eukprot:CAMPEP_0197025486 /NCGR_PEP_ID=MMETSP1384-20130603/5807_1 /TAXON_ID=29189 /ORGANISM="Ammonia sp." /LENGTH=217 /DNA_ID=CAMNT_0042454019 /DNA_START=24 /DNA_END=677 /DNA_ORIENTATION=+
MLTFGQLIPLLAYFGVQASGIPTIRKIINEKSTKSENPLMFVMLVVNGFVWACYGILAAESVVLISNATGVILGIIYCAIFYQFCPNKQQMFKLIQASFAIITILFLFTFFSEPLFAVNCLGLLGSLSAILLMSSPLAVMNAVIRDQTSIYLPIPTVVTTFINALSWLLYGIVVKDPFIWFPNAIGLLAAIVQVGLLFAFEREMPDKPTVDEVGQLL